MMVKTKPVGHLLVRETFWSAPSCFSFFEELWGCGLRSESPVHLPLQPCGDWTVPAVNHPVSTLSGALSSVWLKMRSEFIKMNVMLLLKNTWIYRWNHKTVGVVVHGNTSRSERQGRSPPFYFCFPPPSPWGLKTYRWRRHRDVPEVSNAACGEEHVRRRFPLPRRRDVD